MKLSLSSETQKRIGAILETGRYQTTDALVRASLAALEQQEAFGDFTPGEFDELLAEGERNIAKQGTVPAATVFAELRRRRGEQEKTKPRRRKPA